MDQPGSPGAPELDFRAYIEHANVGVLVLDADRRIVYFNPVYRALMGYGDEVLGHDVVEYLDMANARRVESEFATRRSGAQSEYEVEARTKTGEPVALHVAASPRLTADGTFIGTVAFVTDITEKRSMEAQLQDYAHKLEDMVQARTDALIASEQRYQEIFERVTDGILRVDAQGTILLCNHAFADMVGGKIGDVMGRNMMRLLHAEDRAKVLEIERRRAAGEPVATTHVFRVHRLDTHEVVHLEVSAIVTHREGQIDFIQIIARDVTERIKAEEALRRAYEELRGLSQAKANFLSNITHELKTPLVTVRGYTQMMHGENLGPVNDTQRQALATSLRNIDVLLAQIERILAVSRLELDEGGLRFEAVPVDAFLGDCCADALPVAETKGIDLGLGALAPDLPPLHADWLQLSEAIGHLVDNGIKFTDPGGRVELSAQRSDVGVRLFVRDSGVGIEPERLVKLCEPFEQADGSHTRDYEGLGVGLALVRRIVEAHGGRIGADRAPDRGSVIWCDIPTAHEADTPAAIPPRRDPRPRMSLEPAAVAGGAAETADPAREGDPAEDDEEFDSATFDLDEGYQEPVLFVDDDRDMLRLVEKAFEGANLAISTLDTPELTFERVRASGARVVFLDIAFPGCDGVEICRRLKADPATARIPVYMFSAHTKKDLRRRAKEAGADGFISKPVQLDYLFEVVARHD